MEHEVACKEIVCSATRGHRSTFDLLIFCTQDFKKKNFVPEINNLVAEPRTIADKDCNPPEISLLFSSDPISKLADTITLEASNAR